MYNPEKMDNESGIAYGWMMLSIFLIIMGLLYSFLSGGVVNALINGPGNDQNVGINHDIAQGKLSTQGVNAIRFNIGMFTNIPLWLIIGGFVYAVGRAITVKQVP